MPTMVEGMSLAGHAGKVLSFGLSFGGSSSSDGWPNNFG